MTDSRSREKSLHELEFNDLNIHLYLTLNYGTVSEHLDFDFMVLYNAFVLSWGLTITQNSIRRISDLDRSRLSDTRSAENDRIGADTDPEYRIDASLVQTALWTMQFPPPGSYPPRKDSYVRMLFIDFSSAFNTIIPKQLINKLNLLGLNNSLCNGSWTF